MAHSSGFEERERKRKRECEHMFVVERESAREREPKKGGKKL